jgi:hypothetical protein
VPFRGKRIIWMIAFVVSLGPLARQATGGLAGALCVERGDWNGASQLPVTDRAEPHGSSLVVRRRGC